MPDEVEDIRFAVLTTEFCFISIINTLTVVAFARSRRLRKRSTYLVINQTVADLLVGAVTGPVYQRVYQNRNMVSVGETVGGRSLTAFI